MSTIRQRKNVKKDSKVSDPTQCPPSSVTNAGFKFWGICTVRNIILVIIILMITFYRLKIAQPTKPLTNDLGNIPISQIVKRRLALPSNPILNTYYHREIITSSSTAQEYFDQAMILSAAFNHDEAIRSLKFAVMNDKKCVMCHWGIAYNYGMNINRVNDEERLAVSVKHANLAKHYSKEIKQDPITQDLVDAMILRFPEGRTLEVNDVEVVSVSSDHAEKYLLAFKNAMEKIVEKYPDDADMWLLYAESLMNMMPWNYYNREENEHGLLEYIPKPDTITVYNALRKALEISPNNLLALHLYIHIYEADMKSVIDQNNNVELIADRLRDLLVPNIDKIRFSGIGHLIHMPSHIYIRIGRFEDANIANINAHKVAEDYYAFYNITDIHANYNQFYRVLYYCHRITFVIYSSMMNGQYKLADEYGKYMFDVCKFSTEHISFFFENASWRDKNYLRFGKFQELIDNYLKNDEWKNNYVAGGDNTYAAVQSVYAQAFSYVSIGGKDNCKKGFDIYENEFLPGYNNEEIRSLKFLWEDAAEILEVAKTSFLGRYYDKCENNMEKSAEQWTNAAKQYDNLAYMEPPFWPINNRACLGQVYLDRGEYEKAKEAFKNDLDQIVGNGWGLKGMILALEKLDPNGDEIKEYRKQFEEAWKYADVEIDRACY